MNRIMVKVYGYLKPCGPADEQALRASLILMGPEAEGVLRREGEFLNIAFEGLYFPLEDFLSALSGVLRPASRGKVDYIDMEKWRLSRYAIDGENIGRQDRDLNDALAWSGH